MSTSLVNSSNEKIIFECQQHAANISAKLQKFYEDNDFFDTVLIAGENSIKIPAHRIILSALSDYFWKIFHGNPTNVNEVNMKEIEASTLKLIIDFMYLGAIELSSDNVEPLMRGAVFLKMKSLLKGCCDFMEKHLNKSNCLHSLGLAKKLALAGLQEKSSKMIYKHFEEVREQSGFLLLNEIEVKDLLFNDNPNGDIEEEVFLSLVAWIDHDQINRGHLLIELLSMVRYQFLTPNFVCNNRSSVCKTLEISELINGWLQYYLLTKSRTIEQQKFTVASALEPKKEVILSGVDSVAVAAVGFNGNVLEMYGYDEKLETWILKKRIQTFFSEIPQTSWIVIRSSLFVVGGRVFYNKQYKPPVNTVECVNLKTSQRINIPPMKSQRYDSQLASLKGHLCVFGGGWLTNSVEILNFSTMQWETLKLPFIIDNGRQKICGRDEILYVLDNFYGFLQCYNISSKQWTSKQTPYDDNVKVVGIYVLWNFMYTFCHLKGCSEPTTVIKCLDLSKDTWLEECRFNMYTSSVLTSVIDKIWFLNSESDVFEYNPDTKKITRLAKSKSGNYLIMPFIK